MSCVGDPGPLRYKRSRHGDAQIDRASSYVVARDPANIVSDWQPTGGDERQFCSPGFDLPVGTLSRTPHGLFPEYHSSADNLSLVTAEALGTAFTTALRIVDLLETNASYRNLSPYGEPQLGKRGLYQSVPDGTNPELAYLWVLSLSDETNDLLAIAERSGLPFETIRAQPRHLSSTTCSSEFDERSGRGGHRRRRGIGQATALALGRAGFSVAVVARSSVPLRRPDGSSSRRGRWRSPWSRT